MRIVHIIIGLNVGGAEKMLTNIVHGNKSKNIEHIIFSLSDLGPHGEFLKSEGIQVYGLGWYKTPNKLKLLKRALNEVRKVEPDLIMGWMLHGCLFSHLINRKIKKKLMWNIRFSRLPNSPLKTKFMICLLKYFSKNVDEIIFNSQAGLDYYNNIGLKGKSNCTIANGFNLEQLYPIEEAKSKLCDKLLIPKHSFIIGMVARWDLYKNQYLFFKIADEFITSKVKENRPVHLIFVGNNMTLDNSKIVKFVQQSKNSKHFHFLGKQQKLNDLYSAFDIHCLYSVTEGFPNVIGESMACKTPCVSTEVGDVANIIDKYGWLIEQKNKSQLMKTLNEVYNKNSEDLILMGNDCRSHIKTHFEISNIITKYNTKFLNYE